MLLVIFGAGATYDSYPVLTKQEPMRPPLASQLVDPRFNDIADEIRQSRAVIDRLRERIHAPGATTSLETELASFGSAANTLRRQQLAAFRFYLQEVIERSVDGWYKIAHGQTYYLRLLNHLLDWQIATGERVLLMTFNYDQLIEHAAQDVVTGWGFAGPLSTYVNREDFRIFKVHGSTSWRRRLPSSGFMLGDQLPPALQFVADGGNFDSGDIVSAHIDLMDRPSIQVPALAVPMAGKTAFECPEDHLDALRADLPRVKHVLIVGWRAAEPHAVDLLRGDGGDSGLSPSYDLGIVSGSEADLAETRRNLGDVGRRGRPRVLIDSGFSAFMRGLRPNLELLLSNPDSPHRHSW